MNILSSIKDVTNRQFYKGSGTHIVPRGLIYPVDFGALGTVRYGKKVGSTLPLLAPDNRFTLIEDAVYDTNQLVIERAPVWVEVGGYVSMGQQEIHEVDDVNDNIITLSDSLLADHPTGQFVYHHSNPIEVEGNYIVGQTVISVDSPVRMFRGDVIAVHVLVGGLINTFVEYTVTDLRLISFLNNIYQYQITLDRGLKGELVDDQVIQLRAYLGYRSRILPVPSTSGFARRISGPFYLDWVSAPFRNRLEVEETQTVYFYTTSRIQIDEPRVVEKNEPILRNTIRADQFMFWQKVRGFINYDAGIRRFIMTPHTTDGHWRLKHKCVPRLTVPSKGATGLIVTVDKALLNNNEGFTMNDTIDTTIFEYQVSGAYVPTPSSSATGSINVLTLPTDNQWITIDDGFGSTITFEYKTTPTFVSTPGRYTLDVQSAVLTTDVAILTQEFINSLPGFNITANAVGTLINLTHNKVSTLGNVAIVKDATLLWTIFGMSGGTDAVKTIDIQSVITAVEVAELTSTAINSLELKIRADWPVGGVPSIGLTTSVLGPSANIPIVKNVASPGYIIQGMGGGSGGMQWKFKIKSTTDDVLFRLRFYPNDWQDFNLTAGVESTLLVEIGANDDPVEMIDMLFKAPESSTTEVQMDTWTLNGPRVGAICYEYVARVLGDYNFASTTLFLKQMFQSLDDVAAVHDARLALDRGFMRVSSPFE